MHDMSSDKMCSQIECVQCMIKASTSIHRPKCVKHNNKDGNMLQMSKYGNPQSLVLIRVQTDAKMSKRLFVKNLACIN